jgi:Predicted S-adenosylmethionine-dependent methyltransferase involved in cell envelope biogenesis
MEATMVSDTPKHYPVLLNEIISIITPQHGGTFIDCTFGQGGYTKEILKFNKTRVIALDRDIKSKKKADEIEKKFSNRLLFKNKKFSQLDDLKLKDQKITSVIFDLGYSFAQIKDQEKGLSFNSVGELNMQMGLNDFSAGDAINKLDAKELEKFLIFW